MKFSAWRKDEKRYYAMGSKLLSLDPQYHSHVRET